MRKGENMTVLKRIGIGIGISSFLTIFFKIMYHVETITLTEIIFNYYVALVVSCLSMIDHIEKLSYWQVTLFHFLGSYIAIAGGFFYIQSFTWSHFLNFSLNMIIIYISVWLSFVLKNYIEAKLLTRQINK